LLWSMLDDDRGYTKSRMREVVRLHIGGEVHQICLSDKKDFKRKEREKWISKVSSLINPSARSLSCSVLQARCATRGIIVGLAAQQAGRPELIRSRHSRPRSLLGGLMS